MIIIIRRLTTNRIVNKDAAIIKVLKIFKENEYSKNTLIKEKGIIKVRTKLYDDNYIQKIRSCTTV